MSLSPMPWDSPHSSVDTQRRIRLPSVDKDNFDETKVTQRIEARKTLLLKKVVLKEKRETRKSMKLLQFEAGELENMDSSGEDAEDLDDDSVLLDLKDKHLESEDVKLKFKGRNSNFYRSLSSAAPASDDDDKSINSLGSSHFTSRDWDERRRQLLLDAWTSGLHGKSKLLAGLTLPCVMALEGILERDGRAEHGRAFKLVLWVVNEWPCERGDSLKPANPAALEVNVLSMLEKFRPNGERGDPENTAFLVPPCLQPFVDTFESVEKVGAKCTHDLSNL